MPSASAKIEKVASSEATDPVKAIVNMLEKRIRNLEKRKVKLDNYRTDVSNGKELNEDQKIAVSKYDEVEAVLEFTREFSKAMNSIVQESARQQKKMAKKEQLERQQHEIQRLQEAFIYRHILSCFDNEDVRNDFLTGENGAVKLTNDELAQLDQLYKLIGPGLPNEQADITNHFHVLSENLIFLVEGKNKEIAGTTYKVLKELLHGIRESGYFSRPSTVLEEEITSSDDAQDDDLLEKSRTLEEVEQFDDVTENAVSIENDQSEAEVVEEETPTAMSPTEVEIQPVASVTLQNGPLQEVLSSQGSFNFLQESQIDLDGSIQHYKTPQFVLIAPHMDPAVVAVHQMAPPPVAEFPVSSYPVSAQTPEGKTIMNGTEPCMGGSSPTGRAQPILTTSITRTSTALPSVQPASHEFDPSHPIPTQTFTNQSFAVMQNMMLPQAYVPVTMHHGPIPPHMASIAVVPGLSSPVTSAAPVMPIHMPVAPVMIGPAAVAEAEPADATVEGAVESEDAQQVETEAGSATTQSTSNVPNEQNGNNEGYTHSYRGGFRGRGQRRGNGYFRRPYNNRGFQNHYYQDRNGYNQDRNNSYNQDRNGYNQDRNNYNQDRNGYNQDRNGYNSNFRRGNGRGGPRGNGNNRGRGVNYRTQATLQQQQPQQQQQQQPQQETQQ